MKRNWDSVEEARIDEASTSKPAKKEVHSGYVPDLENHAEMKSSVFARDSKRVTSPHSLEDRDAANDFSSRKGKRGWKSSTHRHEPSRNQMHFRSKHSSGYLDFGDLARKYPFLEPYTNYTTKGAHVDMRNPKGVYFLAKAILKDVYDLEFEMPIESDSHLLPFVPGRANYIHHIADLLCRVQDFDFEGKHKTNTSMKRNNTIHSCSQPQPVRGSNVRVLDVGVGANCIYPLLGTKEYGWSFVGTDISQEALDLAANNIIKNSLEEKISLRHQCNPSNCFRQILLPDEFFCLTMCNPPFYESANTVNVCKKRARLGTENELICAGGEESFLRRMLAESKEFSHQVLWFTSLVSKKVTALSFRKLLWEEMRSYAQNSSQKVQFDIFSARRARAAQIVPSSDSSFPTMPNDFTANVCEFRLFTLLQGKLARWVLCWTYWDKEQRQKILAEISEAESS